MLFRSAVLTLTEFVRSFALIEMATTSEMLDVALAASEVVRVSTTCPEVLEDEVTVQPVPEAETKVRPAGRVSVTVMSLAVGPVPALVTVIV